MAMNRVITTKMKWVSSPKYRPLHQFQNQQGNLFNSPKILTQSEIQISQNKQKIHYIFPFYFDFSKFSENFLNSIF
jgi:hypothetical protein